MAWNEPGGSGDRDPWGGRNNDSGPPDLDEAMRKLQERLGGLFGKRGDGMETGSAPSGRGLGLFALLGVAIWAASGIYVVDEGTRGVVRQFGAYNHTSMPGLRWYARFVQDVQTVDVERIRSIDLGLRREDSLMLTQDENIIDIKFSVQYRIRNDETGARDYLFNLRDPDETLRQATESAVREVVGKSKMDFVITGGRSEVAARAMVLAQEVLDRYNCGLVITTLNMQDAQAPEEVQPAFADAVRAREDEQRLKNEAEAYANDVLPKARGQAARIIEEANAYKETVIAKAEGEANRFAQVLTQYQAAPEVTRQRLYLDTMERVLGSTSKVVVDTEGGNNLLYLPIDRLMQGGGGGTSSTTVTLPSLSNSDLPASNENLRNTTGDARGRDNRRTREVR